MEAKKTGLFANGLIWFGAAVIGAAISTVLLIATRKRQLAKQAA